MRLIHVIDELSFAFSVGDGFANSGEILIALRNAGGEILNEAQTRVQANGLKVDTVLSDTLARRVCALVIAQAGVWGAVGRLFMGSDAENIVRTAPIPVLLLRSIVSASKAVI